MLRVVPVLCLCCLASAADLTPDTLLLQRVRVGMSQTLTRLPNYTCLQTIARSSRAGPKKKLVPVDTVRIEVALVDGKELFAWPGSKRFQDTEIRKMVVGGAIGTGSFAGLAKSVFQTRAPRFEYKGLVDRNGAKSHRWDYFVGQLVSNYHLRVGEREAVVGYHGSFWVDPKSLDVQRLEVIADDIPVHLELDGAQEVIEYARVQVGEEMFLLPSASEMQMTSPKGHTSINRTTWGSCRQYSGESTLVFEDPDPDLPSQAPERTLTVPAGLKLELALDARLETSKLAVGDPVLAALRKPVKIGDGVVAPKGAQVRRPHYPHRPALHESLPRLHHRPRPERTAMGEHHRDLARRARVGAHRSAPNQRLGARPTRFRSEDNGQYHLCAGDRASHPAKGCSDGMADSRTTGRGLNVIQFELETDRRLFESAMQFAQQQVRSLIESHPDFYPMYTQGGKWKHEGPAWTHWCDGFLPGMMWIFHRSIGPGAPDADWWMDQAIRYTTPLEQRQHDKAVHDLGFIFLSSYYRWHRLTQQEEQKEVLVQAGQTLANRFQEKGQYLSSFIAQNSLFIDLIMNVALIFYAARETDDRMLRDIALRHALTTRRVLVRGDGSTAHEGIFDEETGEFLRQSTQQGYRADSCWSRGLVWSMYGFSTCYEYSRDPRFLETAQACTDYYITHSPADGIPPWDFNAPAESRKLLDTSAAAIAASGMLRLCRLVPDPMKGHFYWTTAIRILRGLCDKHLATKNGSEGILTGGVYHLHKNLGVNEATMWGDYFFVEALDSALRLMK